MVFFFNPSFYYFRAWEYYADFVFKYRNVDRVWEGYETGDLGRNNFFFYDGKHKSKVSVDEYGFRLTPESNDARVLVFGDSTIFGSGLSDSETLPWRLQKRLNLPVLNGSRTFLQNALKHPKVKNATTVFDCKTERELAWMPLVIVNKFQPIAKQDKELGFDFLNTSPH